MIYTIVNYDIILFWIPSHVGIVGNTKVDLLEKTSFLPPILCL